MKILVTGASGFVGSHLVPALLDAGHSVRALVRSDQAETRIRSRIAGHWRDAGGATDATDVATIGSAGSTAGTGGSAVTGPGRRTVEFTRGDVTKPETLGPATLGVDAVIHLVAIPRDRNGGRDLARINTTGTLNVMDAMRATGVRRLVHQGAMGVADDPRLHYSASKARAEAAVAASGLEWTILKPSLLFGERDGFFNIIADLVRISPGVVPIAARQRSRFQPLSVRDWARVAVRVLERPDTVGQAYPLGGPRYWTYREMTEEVIRAMGKRRAILPMPLPLIKLVARGSELVRLPFPVGSDQLRQLAFDNIGPLDSVSRAFGFEPLPMEGNLGYLRRRLKHQEPVADRRG